MEIGFIGLGNMGRGMAANLLNAGHHITVYNRSPAKAEALVQQGATAARSVAEACSGAVVFTMLADDQAVENVTFGDPGGEQGIVASLGPGATHVSSSTISVAMSQRLAAAHAEAGQQYVAAPVFGRPEAASAAKLFVIAAGDPQVLQPLVPLFDAIGQRTFVVSEQPHTANLVKLSGNFLIASAIESVGEAVALVAKAGVDRLAVRRHPHLDVVRRSGVSDLWRADRATGIRAGRVRGDPRTQGHPSWCSLLRNSCKCRCPSPACCAIAYSPWWQPVAGNWIGRRVSALADRDAGNASASGSHHSA